jgi:cobalt-precorrin-6B (C15)-methyltransferase
VTVEAARRAGRVTALERKADRLETTRANLAANETSADVRLRQAEAPEGLPDDADALFVGGSRNYEAVLVSLAARFARVVSSLSAFRSSAVTRPARRAASTVTAPVQEPTSTKWSVGPRSSFLARTALTSAFVGPAFASCGSDTCVIVTHNCRGT